MMQTKKEKELLGGHESHGGRGDLGPAASPERPHVMPEHRGFAGVVGLMTCKAVLLRLGGEMETVIEFRYPPPPDYREPMRRRLSLKPDADTIGRYDPYPCRTFALDLRLRSPDHKWWFVYNNGATQTPFDAYVYREVGSVTEPQQEHADPPRRSAAQKTD